MKLYKFKSLKSMDHIIDIIRYKRIYAGSFFDLNDPMEGSFYIESHLIHLMNNIQNEKMKWGVCSLSTTYQNPLMWAHYADNFKGICFELEFDKETSDFMKCPVKYDNKVPSIDSISMQGHDESQIALKILSRKIINWKYEKEVRLLTKNNHIDCQIKSILLGLRVSEDVTWLFKELRTHGFDIYRTRNSDSKIEKAVKL